MPMFSLCRVSRRLNGDCVCARDWTIKATRKKVCRNEYSIISRWCEWIISAHRN